jgi:uncharacterized protein with HEPN domain
MNKNDLVRLNDILECCRLIQSYISGIDKSEFLQSSIVQDAVIRRIEIIGEATKNISEEARQASPNTPRRSIAGMRDISIHQYSRLNIDRVWNTATVDIQVLVPEVERLIAIVEKHLSEQSDQSQPKE